MERNPLWAQAIRNEIQKFLDEDELFKNHLYLKKLPSFPVECVLKVKSPLVLSGLPFFFQVFSCLGEKDDWFTEIGSWEGKFIADAQEVMSFKLPFSVALSGERLALNLLARSSAVSTLTRQFVDKAQKYQIRILDTRKTTPGLRWLEKYAVTVGGGHNHRFSQTDAWMIKDNHKTCLGGLQGAVDFFRGLHGQYTPLIVEVHDLSEIQLAYQLGVKHLLLDNFTPAMVQEALNRKQMGTTFEISGGVSLSNIDSYLIDGVDAISIGGLTHSPPAVDISLKFRK